MYAEEEYEDTILGDVYSDEAIEKIKTLKTRKEISDYVERLLSCYETGDLLSGEGAEYIAMNCIEIAKYLVEHTLCDKALIASFFDRAADAVNSIDINENYHLYSSMHEQLSDRVAEAILGIIGADKSYWKLLKRAYTDVAKPTFVKIVKMRVPSEDAVFTSLTQMQKYIYNRAVKVISKENLTEEEYRYKEENIIVEITLQANITKDIVEEIELEVDLSAFTGYEYFQHTFSEYLKYYFEDMNEGELASTASACSWGESTYSRLVIDLDGYGNKQDETVKELDFLIPEIAHDMTCLDRISGFRHDDIFDRMRHREEALALVIHSKSSMLYLFYRSEIQRYYAKKVMQTARNDLDKNIYEEDRYRDREEIDYRMKQIDLHIKHIALKMLLVARKSLVHSCRREERDYMDSRDEWAGMLMYADSTDDNSSSVNLRKIEDIKIM